MIQVVKRNGVSVDFHPDKIQIAISKANKEVDKDLAKSIDVALNGAPINIRTK